MNVDFYISSLSGGGAEHVLITLAQQLSAAKHKVSITSLEKRPQFYPVDSSIAVIKHDNTKTPPLKEAFLDFIQIRKQMKARTDTDVVISFLSRCNLLVLIASLFLRKKTIVCDRNNPLKEHSRAVFYLSCIVYKLASGIVVQTNEIKSYYPTFLQNKIHVIENPLDINSLEKQCEGELLEKEKTIVSIGRLEPQKDFVTLIDAFANIQGNHPKWSLKIFGKGHMQEELQAYINNKNLTDCVKLCGVTYRPFLALKRSAIFVLSSHYEGFPNVLCEAMGAALPCISSNCVSGPKELITDGENGLLFEIGDVDALTKQLIYLIETPFARQQMGERAKKSVERLNVEEIHQKWLDVVHVVVNNIC